MNILHNRIERIEMERQ